AGEDVSTGTVVVQERSRLRPQDIAAIASTGTASIETFKPLRIGIVSSGDEVLRPGAPFENGKVYDANQYMLSSLLKTMPVEAVDLGVCPDNQASVITLLEKASEGMDVIISSGGASRGEEDHFVSALEQLGKCHMWQLAIKPGRPMCFGQIGDVPCFTLPGNPVAAFVCFLLYVYPALTRLGGGHWPELERIPVASAFAMKSKPDRREYLRGFLAPHGENGGLHARKFERDGSGLISGLQAATGLIEIPEDCTHVDVGQPVNFIPLSQFGIVS
ncbi:MAG: molybdopterin molybdotransferase MoeA, partial [Pseudomonadota bacterium]